jgi:hypothetical protein
LRNKPTWSKVDWPSPKEWQRLLNPYADELIAEAYADITKPDVLKEVKNEEGIEGVTTLRNRCAIVLSKAIGDYSGV